jgi:hypothetical protein
LEDEGMRLGKIKHQRFLIACHLPFLDLTVGSTRNTIYARAASIQQISEMKKVQLRG